MGYTYRNGRVVKTQGRKRDYGPPPETLAQMWAGWRAAVLDPMDPPADPVQVQECRRAFTAGVFAMIGTMRRIGEPDVAEDLGVLHIERLYQDCLAFYEDVKAGRA